MWEWQFNSTFFSLQGDEIKVANGSSQYEFRNDVYLNKTVLVSNGVEKHFFFHIVILNIDFFLCSSKCSR